MLRPASWMFSVDSMAVRMGPGVRGVTAPRLASRRSCGALGSGAL